MSRKEDIAICYENGRKPEFVAVIPKKITMAINAYYVGVTKGYPAFKKWVDLRIREKKLDCPKSFDSAIRLIFQDGSIGFLANPSQEAFEAFYYPVFSDLNESRRYIVYF